MVSLLTEASIEEMDNFFWGGGGGGGANYFQGYEMDTFRVPFS